MRRTRPEYRWRRFAPRYDPDKAEYLVAADPSLGTGFDPAAAHLLRLDLSQLDPQKRDGPLIVQDAVLYGQVEPDDLALMCHGASTHHHRCRIAAEDNGIGAQVVGALVRLRARQVTRRSWDPIARRSIARPGWHTDSASKPACLSTLRRAIAEGLVEVNDYDTAKDLTHIEIGEGRGGEIQAITRPGATDHLTMALAIGVHIFLTEHIRAWFRTDSAKGDEKKIVKFRYPHQKPTISTWQIKPGRERWGN